MFDLLAAEPEHGIGNAFVTQIDLLHFGARGIDDAGEAGLAVGAAVFVVLDKRMHVLELQIGAQPMEQGGVIAQRRTQCLCMSILQFRYRRCALRIADGLVAVAQIEIDLAFSNCLHETGFGLRPRHARQQTDHEQPGYQRHVSHCCPLPAKWKS